jgi:hypothetical protein
MRIVRFLINQLEAKNYDGSIRILTQRNLRGHKTHPSIRGRASSGADWTFTADERLDFVQSLIGKTNKVGAGEGN